MKKLLASNGTDTRRVSLGEFSAMDTDVWVVVECGTRKKKRRVREWIKRAVYEIWILDFGEMVPVIFGVRSATKAHAKVARAIIDVKGTETPEEPLLMFGGVAVGVAETQAYIQKYRKEEAA